MRVCRVSPEVFSACAVMRSMSSGDLVTGPANENGTMKSVTTFPVIPLSVPRSDLIKEQRADPTLEELRDQIVPVEKLGDVDHGYFLQFVNLEHSHINELVHEALQPTI